MIKNLNKFADWIVSSKVRYFIAQWILYTVLFLGATFTVACFYALITGGVK